MRSLSGRQSSGRWPPLWPVGAILAAYAVPLLIVPPTLGLPLIDDWSYQRSVARLVEDGELWVAPWTATTLVLQIGWGALFALPFGAGPVVLRGSTLVASFGGTLAAYALYRALGATKPRAVIGALAVWFNPIGFGLSYTFMTEVPYLALLTAAAWATVRAAGRGSLGELTASSGLAALAFLVRPQGALIPLATVGWLLLARPAWFRAAPASTIAVVLGPCLVAVVGYLHWAAGRGLPAEQADRLATLREISLAEVVDLGWRLAVIGCFFVGLFVFPLVLGALRELPAAWRCVGGGARAVALCALAVLALWMNGYALAHDGRSFPFIPWGSMIHEDGLGVLDADGLRPFVFEPWQWAALGLLFALSAVGGFLLLAAAHGRPAPAGGASKPPVVGLVVALGLGQFLGVLPPSLQLHHENPGLLTFDRYYLPLLPVALGLVLWALRGRRFSPGLALAALLLLGVVDAVGVQDWLAFKRAQWETAEWLVEERGVPLRQVDVSPQWAGLHFYEYGLTHPHDRVRRRTGDPWWLFDIAPMIDPVFVVAASPDPRPGYRVYLRRRYRSWIRSADEAWVYVWHRRPAP